MGFSLFLNLLAWKFKKALKKDTGFKKFLMGHECRIVIKTKDGKKGKRFIFENGGFTSDNALDDYDAAMIWSNAKTAFRSMKEGEDGIKRALQNHQVSIDGKIHSFTWFGAALKFVTTT
ncbi:MAG TPA: hypothetical protein P5294_06725 [Smithellaceae bacterium]|nr:hypothetical protein [Smithellaceae bacterium]HRS88873.1 hypothetical protein [Smithellaceae bacterium]HRV26212.1 hypothetical protein [Smithellaceae bacterium]